MLLYKLTFYPGDVDGQRLNLHSIPPHVVSPFLSLFEKSCYFSGSIPGADKVSVEWKGTPDGQALFTFFLDKVAFLSGGMVIGSDVDIDKEILQGYVVALRKMLNNQTGAATAFQKLIDQPERPLLVTVIWPVMSTEQYAQLAGLDVCMCAAFLQKIGVSKNAVVDMQYVDIESLVELARDDDDMLAQCELGYRFAHSSKPNLVEAFNWYKRAATQGLTDAINEVAGCYENGLGVEEDLTQAAYWYRCGAEKGEPACMANLGEFYEYGKGGLPLDLRQALFYYNQALEKGFTAVSPAIERVKSNARP